MKVGGQVARVLLSSLPRVISGGLNLGPQGWQQMHLPAEPF